MQAVVHIKLVRGFRGFRGISDYFLCSLFATECTEGHAIYCNTWPNNVDTPNRISLGILSSESSTL